MIICEREKLQIVNIKNPNYKSKETKNIIFVFNHMTSGASSPCYGLNSYYTDILDRKWDGFCELTKKGFLQLFKLGKIYQKRFYKLLNLSNPDITKVRSFASQANKTLMSSNAFFYGMYNNKDTPIEEQITVGVRNFRHYEGNGLIPIFYYTESTNCKGWKKIIEDNLKIHADEINERLNIFMNRYKNIFELLRYEERIINSKTLYEKVNLFCTSYISNYYDETLSQIEIIQSLNYTKEKLYDIYYDCLEFNLYKYIEIEYGCEAKKVPKIVLFDLINDTIYNMEESIKNPNSPKYVSYIGHDSTMAGMQIIFKELFNITPKIMNYASNQFFLLYKLNDNYNGTEIDKNYIVKYFFNDELSMVISYDKFKKSLLDLNKTSGYNLELFCEGSKSYDYVILCLFAAILILFFIIVRICRYNKNMIFNKKKYISLKEESKEKIVEIKN